MNNYVDFSILKGKTLVSIEGVAGDEYVVFTTSEGEKFQLYHQQDCCEHVYLQDVMSDAGGKGQDAYVDLIGLPLLVAEETSDEVTDDVDPGSYGGCGSHTWTFYRLATMRGFVIFRWLGESNGYYSESVSFARVS